MRFWRNIEEYQYPTKYYDGFTTLTGRQFKPLNPISSLSLQHKDALRTVAGKCQICGWKAYPEALIIHHHDRNPHNNLNSNLFILCRNCHYLVHRGLLEEPTKVNQNAT